MRFGEVERYVVIDDLGVGLPPCLLQVETRPDFRVQCVGRYFDIIHPTCTNNKPFVNISTYTECTVDTSLSCPGIHILHL